ncbi:hypothetical protein M3B43_06500 [Nesterenkonia massiliensis]|uniref:Uncharacterized protein n=1 Tax=Nesterenkonia massiliensis TaxID=1232429 RepID=A0ABT2HQL1_9MICC|nr:hypothetical protein [Nesterenkonia massiliensis]MCT1606982.1 hypothetical protein [Nesterenkonia massiliensis]
MKVTAETAPIQYITVPKVMTPPPGVQAAGDSTGAEGAFAKLTLDRITH